MSLTVLHFNLFSITLQTVLQVCNMNLLNKPPPPLTSVPILQTNSPIKKACSSLLFQPKLPINFHQSAQVQMKVNGYADLKALPLVPNSGQAFQSGQWLTTSHWAQMLPSHSPSGSRTVDPYFISLHPVSSRLPRSTAIPLTGMVCVHSLQHHPSLTLQPFLGLTVTQR